MATAEAVVAAAAAVATEAAVSPGKQQVY